MQPPSLAKGRLRAFRAQEEKLVRPRDAWKDQGATRLPPASSDLMRRVRIAQRQLEHGQRLGDEVVRRIATKALLEIIGSNRRPAVQLRAVEVLLAHFGPPSHHGASDPAQPVR